jgi:hypothetical protein
VKRGHKAFTISDSFYGKPLRPRDTILPYNQELRFKKIIKKYFCGCKDS